MVNAKGMSCSHFFWINLCLMIFFSIAITQREAIPSRDRRPSDKVAAQRSFFPPFSKTRYNLFFLGEAEREEAQKKADKEQRRAMRKKKAEQKANQLAGKETDSEDEFEPRSNPLVGIFNSISILY